MYKIDNYIKLLVKSKYNGGSDSNNIDSNKLIRNPKFRGGAASDRYPNIYLQELLFRKSTTNAADLAGAGAAGVFELKNQDRTVGPAVAGGAPGAPAATDLTRLIAGFTRLAGSADPLAEPLNRAFDPPDPGNALLRLVPGDGGHPQQPVDGAGNPMGPAPAALTPDQQRAPRNPARWFSQWGVWDGRRGQEDIIQDMIDNFDFWKEGTATTPRAFFLAIAGRLQALAAAGPPAAGLPPDPDPAVLIAGGLPPLPAFIVVAPGVAPAAWIAGGPPPAAPGGGPPLAIPAAGAPLGVARGLGAAALRVAAAGVAIVPGAAAAAAAVAAAPTRSKKILFKGMRYGIIKNSIVANMSEEPLGVEIELPTYTIIQVGDELGADEPHVYNYFFTILSGPHKGKRILIPIEVNLIPYEENQDSGPSVPLGFKVDLYKNTGGGDVLLGSRTVTRNDTIKSVIDSVKGSNPNQRCIVTSHKNFLNSIGPKDYYVTFGNLRLQYEQVELWLI